MRRLIVLIALVAAVGGAGYLFLFKKKEITQTFNSASGYPDAKTAKEAVDLFCKAIAARDFGQASRYATGPFSQELAKGASAAGELAEKIDDLTSRMKNDGVMTDELKLVLYFFDPFWKDIKGTASGEGEREAVATLFFEGITLTGQDRPYETWQIDNKMFRSLSRDLPLPGRKAQYKVVKDDEGVWRIAFPASQDQQLVTARLVERYKDYVNPFKILSMEIKNDPTTKENVKKRLKELLEEAARN